MSLMLFTASTEITTTQTTKKFTDRQKKIFLFTYKILREIVEHPEKDNTPAQSDSFQISLKNSIVQALTEEDKRAAKDFYKLLRELAVNGDEEPLYQAKKENKNERFKILFKKIISVLDLEKMKLFNSLNFEE